MQASSWSGLTSNDTCWITRPEAIVAPVRRAWSIAAVTAAFAVGAGGFPGADAWAAKPAGAVVSAKPLPTGLWIPGTTSRAYKLNYATTDARGRRALEHRHGLPAQGQGAARRLAGDLVGARHVGARRRLRALRRRPGAAQARPALPRQLDEGGLRDRRERLRRPGTPGLPAYLNGRSEAHNIVDIVKAGRAYTGKLLAPQVGRHRPVAGRRRGDLHGALRDEVRRPRARLPGGVGTGTPAYIEIVVDGARAGLPAALPGRRRLPRLHLREPAPDLTPSSGSRASLTATGAQVPRDSPRRQCVVEFEKAARGRGLRAASSRARSRACRSSAQTLVRLPGHARDGVRQAVLHGSRPRDTDVPTADRGRTSRS